ATRTRYTSIIDHNPLWGKGQNLYVFGAMIISIIIQIIITEITWFNRVFHTAPVPIKYIFPTLGFGMTWLLIDELRKWCVRTWPHGLIARIAW
ncbi:unnamed protein product, partial [Adineta steineri]